MGAKRLRRLMLLAKQEPSAWIDTSRMHGIVWLCAELMACELLLLGVTNNLTRGFEMSFSIRISFEHPTTFAQSGTLTGRLQRRSTALETRLSRSEGVHRSASEYATIKNFQPRRKRPHVNNID